MAYRYAILASSRIYYFFLIYARTKYMKHTGKTIEIEKALMEFIGRLHVYPWSEGSGGQSFSIFAGFIRIIVLEFCATIASD